MQKKKQMGPLVVIFLTIFIDLIGFGMIIPLNPYLGAKFGATSTQVGMLMSIYSLMQFLFSPLWGRLSDRIGRRPVLLVSLLGGAVSYVLFAFATQLWMLFVSRALAGIFAANISTAMAYIADVTSKEERSKGMGLIGAAFGLGFIFGPVFGGVLGEIGNHLGSEPPFGISFSAMGAAAICLINFLVATRTLKESLKPEFRNMAQRGSRFKLMQKYVKRPVLPLLMLIFFLSGLSMAHMESTLFLFVKDEWGWALRAASMAFAYIGVVMVFTQGYLIRKLMPKFGERKVLVVGLTLACVGLCTTGLTVGIYSLALSQTFLALGVGMVNPSTLGSISLLVPVDEQGEAMGVNQSFAALARILGPALGGFYYGHLGHRSPFLIAGSLMAVAVVIAISIFQKLPSRGKV